jgi:hypothetical protein
LPENGLRDSFVQTAFAERARQDAQAAAHEALGLPSGQLRQSAARAAVMVWAQSDPQAALQWSVSQE